MLVKTLFTFCLIIIYSLVSGQRIYHSNSVLSNGNWFEIAVKDPGIYKIDVAFLSSLGINMSNIASSSIRLFGNGGSMLPENNIIPRPDDLYENAIMVFDGGDGVFNNNDYFLFYAPGPDKWVTDASTLGFHHQKNLYSDKAYYFISINTPGSGKRISAVNNSLNPTITISNYQFHYFHELDTVNFLSSGKEWYGEEFTNAPGKLLSRNFLVTIPNVLPQPISIVSNVVSRSAGAFSRFDVQVNNSTVLQHNIAFTGTALFDPFAVADQQVNTFVTTQPDLNIKYLYTPGSLNAQGWLNWFEIAGKGDLSMNGVDQLPFRDRGSVSPGSTGKFIIKNCILATRVWDITDLTNTQELSGNLTGSDYSFVNDCSSLHEYIAFNSNNYMQPTVMGRIAPQNLHNSSVVDLMIIAYSPFLQQAQRLANYHIQHDNLRSVVVTTDQVYNEFSSGLPDPGAIRDFTKMYFDKASTNIDKPKYLLLFGNGSFDFKSRLNNNTNFVPSYESSNSLDPLATYVSDDYFGFLKDNSDINNNGILNLLDIGIGRLPVKTVDEATSVVDKIISYTQKESLGPWRNELTFVADDEDNNLHLQDAEIISNTVITQSPVFNIEKIYLDAFQQESVSGGSRYPTVNIAINNRIYSGNLIWNYNGHGGYNILAEEDILDQQMVNGWSNQNKLPLFITATCDFAPYDNPLLASVGSNLIVRPKTGAIALITTSRVVVASSNRIMNNNYLQYATLQDATGKYLSLGESIKQAKNFTYQNYTDIINNRKFTLLGDPALTIGYPQNKIITTTINNTVITTVPDTLKALGKYTVAGEITDPAGNILSNFNGTAYPVVFDKPSSVSTLANDPTSQVTTFQSQNNIVYRGKATVINGKFSYTFIVPKDINYQFGNGKLSYYAENGSFDGNGFFKNFIIGGLTNGVSNDNQGPIIRAFLNDEKFVNGGTSNETPILVVNLSDSSGINTTGIGIGHDITAVLDKNSRMLFELNDFYEADINSYQKGTVRFQMPRLDPGFHTLTIKAFDVFNNSSEYVLEFRVAKDETLTLTHILNYPNPFTTKTSFWFEHNHPEEILEVQIRIFTITGKLVKSIQKTIINNGDRSSDLEWDGKDDFGEKIARGVYLYSLSVICGSKRSSGLGKLMKL